MNKETRTNESEKEDENPSMLHDFYVVCWREREREESLGREFVQRIELPSGLLLSRKNALIEQLSAELVCMEERRSEAVVSQQLMNIPPQTAFDHCFETHNWSEYDLST